MYVYKATLTSISLYHIAGNFRGVLIFVIFVTDLNFAPYKNLRQ